MCVWQQQQTKKSSRVCRFVEFICRKIVWELTLCPQSSLSFLYRCLKKIGKMEVIFFFLQISSEVQIGRSVPVPFCRNTKAIIQFDETNLNILLVLLCGETSPLQKMSFFDVPLKVSLFTETFLVNLCFLQVLLCFSRDTSVLEHFAYNSATPPRSFIRGKETFI